MTEITPGEKWYTAEEVAELLHMSAVWVRDRRKEGSLKAKKITSAGRGRYLYSQTAIDKFMASLPEG